MRIKQLILLLIGILSLPADAAWTGIGAFFADGEEQWTVGGGDYIADQRSYGLHVEEKTSLDLRVGASVGQFYTRLVDPNGLRETEKYDGEFLSLYLRWPHRLSDRVKLHSMLDYRFNLGNLSRQDEVEMDWSVFSLNLGLGVNLGRVSLRPFIEYRRVDGDISGLGPTRLIDSSSQQGGGVVFELLVDAYAYLRVAVHGGVQDMVYFSLVREF